MSRDTDTRPDDEMTAEAPLVPELSDRTHTTRVVDDLRRDVDDLRRRLDRIEARLEERS